MGGPLLLPPQNEVSGEGFTGKVHLGIKRTASERVNKREVES